MGAKIYEVKIRRAVIQLAYSISIGLWNSKQHGERNVQGFATKQYVEYEMEQIQWWGFLCGRYDLAMTVNTLSSKLAPIELQDPDGQNVRLGSLWSTKPVVIVFLRHYG